MVPELPAAEPVCGQSRHSFAAGRGAGDHRSTLLEPLHPDARLSGKGRYIPLYSCYIHDLYTVTVLTLYIVQTA